MKEEVDKAAAFVSGLLTKKVESADFLEFFQFQLGEELRDKYKDHWHVRNPNRGSAFRAINIQHNKIDEKILEPLIRSFICVNRMTKQEAKAEAIKIGKHLPQELTLWIDPRDVSYRIGDHGSIGVIYSGKSDSEASDELDTSLSSSSSLSSSASSSPCSSPPPSASPSYTLQQQYQHPPAPMALPPPRPSAYQYSYPPPQRQCRQQAFMQSPTFTQHLHREGGLVFL